MILLFSSKIWSCKLSQNPIMNLIYDSKVVAYQGTKQESGELSIIQKVLSSN